MATGRTVASRWDRCYVDGYDFSGQARKIGPLSLEYDAADLTALADPVKGYYPNHPNVNVGAINSVFDNTATTGIHNRLATAGAIRTVTVARGIRAAPAQGDPVFAGQFTQGEYSVAEDGGAMTVNLPFVGWAEDATSLLFASPWGVLLNNSTRTAVNAAAGVDNDTGGATTHSAFIVYQVTAGNGTATITAQEASINSDVNFAAITGLTTGSIDCAVVQYGLVAGLPTATIKQYTRWQISLGTATTVTFVLSLHRG